MKYIFVAGAPGSKWSSVVKNIYYSNNIDRSDYSESRTYYHDARGKMQLMHLGAYFDPGMEFGDWFDDLSAYNKQQCEQEFDRPFSGTGVRVIKSHMFSHHLYHLKRWWPECPLILVKRSNDSCLGWWVRCGQFDITYPSYHGYYKNLQRMAQIIDKQNSDITKYWQDNIGIDVVDNRNLCKVLGIDMPPVEFQQTYADDEIEVAVF